MKSVVRLGFLLSILILSTLSQLAQDKSLPGNAPAKKQPATTDTKQDPDDDVIRVKTNLVTVPVLVLNREGKYLQDLRRSDFHVYEDNVEQAISFFSDSESPLGIVLLIDTSDSVAHAPIGRAVEALIDQLRPNDTVFPVAFDSVIRAPLAKSTSDKILLRNTIREMLSKPSGGSGGTRILDTIDFTNKHLLPTAAGRKVVIVYSDGVDSRSKIGTRKRTLYDVTELGAPYYTFAYYSSAYNTMRSFMGDEWFNELERARRDGQQYLRDLAERSGGRFVVADGHYPDTVKNAYAALGNELLHQYFLSYVPQNGSSNQRRQIKVKVDRPGAKVRARPSYIYEPLDK